MQFFQNDILPTAKFEDSVFECDEWEISPGVVLERRMVLGGGLGFLAALFSPVTLIAFGQELTKKVSNPSDSEIIELEALIATLRPEARLLIASEKPDEEKYVQMAIKELSRVNKLDTYRFMPNKKGGWETDFQAFVPPVLLYQIRMSPCSGRDGASS